jgi:SAM-dependent methyltransferase
MRGLVTALLKAVNAAVRRLSSWTHHAQYIVEWGISPKPEWFDHFLDQHWQWSSRKQSFWVERGVFSRLVIKPGAKVLEICCGDGFNARHFYASQGGINRRARFRRARDLSRQTLQLLQKRFLRSAGHSPRTSGRPVR